MPLLTTAAKEASKTLPFGGLLEETSRSELLSEKQRRSSRSHEWTGVTSVPAGSPMPGVDRGLGTACSGGGGHGEAAAEMAAEGWRERERARVCNAYIDPDNSCTPASKFLIYWMGLMRFLGLFG
jgi:hypothetical protein